MKKVMLFVLALLMVAIPVSAASLQGSGTTSEEGYMLASTLVLDQEDLLESRDEAVLETMYRACAEENGFTPIVCTVSDFRGMSAESFAGRVYDEMGYPTDGILYLVSLTEGEWYILTNGACYQRISDRTTQRMGEQLVAYLRDGAYFEAFALFPELAGEAYAGGGTASKNYGKIIAVSMVVGLAIGGISVGIMAAQMKSVRAKRGAADYMRSGSMRMYNSRDIFLYSHVSRTPKPKSSSSGGSGGGSRGGAGGRI